MIAPTITYATAHGTYRDAGWPGPLPLRDGTKWPPPEGWTGWAGAYPSWADSTAWSDPDDYGDTRQLALRMADGVIGIDVDHYGVKRGADTIAEAERRWGPLPLAPYSSARGEGPSGIRFYSVPTGTVLRTVIKFPELGLGSVEIIQRHHRYAVAWPSVHPETGRDYTWWHTAGPDRPPKAGLLPALPQGWLDALAGAAEPGEAEADPETVAAFAREHRGATARHMLRGAASVFARDAEHGTRHDAMLAAACMAAREARAGLYPAAEAVAPLRDAFVRALAQARAGQRLVPPAEARREFDGMWAWAVGQALSLTPTEALGRCGKVATGASRGGGVLLGGPSMNGHATARQLEMATPALRVVEDHETAELDAEALEMEEERRFAADVAYALRQRAVRRAADEAERPPVEPIAAGVLRWSAIATVRPPRMRVGQLLAESAITWLSGRSGSYKSFLGVALGMSVATGTQVCGHRDWAVSEPLVVLYVAAEGPAGVSIRAQAYAAHHGLDDATLERRFVLYPKRVDLRSEAGRRAVRAFVTAENIGMVVYDTWHKVTPGLDDNSRQEIGEVMMFLDELRDDLGIESVVVDHTGHAGERTTGSSSKVDDADCSLIIRMPGRERTPDVQRTLVVDKLKDAETSGMWDLHLVPVPSVTDDEGRAARVLAVGSVPAESARDIHGDQDWRHAALPVDVRDYAGTGRESLSIVAQLVMAHGGGDSGISRAEVLRRFRTAVPGLSPDASFARVLRAWDALYALDRLDPVNASSGSKVGPHTWADKII